MTTIKSAERPLLAICVPTFNRAASLRNLLISLETIKNTYGDEIEICVSNNGSTDETREIIEEFADKYKINVHHKTVNIGGTLNIISVASQMQAHWGMWCGDDDELDVDGVKYLVNQLKVIPKSAWLLIDSSATNGKPLYMQRLPAGSHRGIDICFMMLRSGMEFYGFMGVHVFPRAAVQIMQTLDLIDAQPWPHIAVLIRYILRCDSVRVHISHEVVVQQAKGGASLFWYAGDQAIIYLSKLIILKRVCLDIDRVSFVMHLLMVRELYSINNFTLLLAWKLYEPEDYNRRSIQVYYQNGWKVFGGWMPVVIPHMLAVFVLNGIPFSWLQNLLKIVGKEYLINKYSDRKRNLSKFSGISRGL